MKCPFCGEEMEHGFLYSSQSIGFPWYPDGEKPMKYIPEFERFYFQISQGDGLGSVPGISVSCAESHAPGQNPGAPPGEINAFLGIPGTAHDQ